MQVRVWTRGSRIKGITSSFNAPKVYPFEEMERENNFNYALFFVIIIMLNFVVVHLQLILLKLRKPPPLSFIFIVDKETLSPDNKFDFECIKEEDHFNVRAWDDLLYKQDYIVIA